MIIVAIAGAGAGATTVMTVFSYQLSKARSVQFREPELLNSHRGWVLHHGIGWMISGIFHAVWEFTSFPPDLLSGGILGLLAAHMVFGVRLPLVVTGESR